MNGSIVLKVPQALLTAYTFRTLMYAGAIRRYWKKEVIMCQGSSYRSVSFRCDWMRVEFPTKINEEIKYKPVVAAIESTMFLKSESVKTSEKVRPPFSFERPWIPLTAMNMAAN